MKSVMEEEEVNEEEKEEEEEGLKGMYHLFHPLSLASVSDRMAVATTNYHPHDKLLSLPQSW